MQLQPAALRPVVDALGVAVDTHLLIELEEGESSVAGGFAATIRAIPK